MSTQWKKLSQEQPKEGQAIWYRYTKWDSSAQSAFKWAWEGRCINDLIPNNEFIWCPAEVPESPPDESEAAFNDWWKTNRDAQSWKESAQGAWNAALAWHKNKAKE